MRSLGEDVGEAQRAKPKRLFEKHRYGAYLVAKRPSSPAS